MTPSIDLRTDLERRTTTGQNWAVLRNASDPRRVRPAAVLIACTDRYRSVVRIAALDADGQVHFVQLDTNDPEARALLETVA